MAAPKALAKGMDCWAPQRPRSLAAWSGPTEIESRRESSSSPHTTSSFCLRIAGMPEEKFIAVTYPPLYRAMLALITDSVAALSGEFGDPPKWPEAQFYDVTFPASGGAQTSVAVRPNYGEALRKVWLKVVGLPSYGMAVTELRKLEKEGKAVGHWGSDLGSAYAFPLLEKYVAAGLPLRFQEEGFAKCYDEVESYLSSPTATVRMFLALQHLKSDLPTMQLDSNHRILTIDEETARRLLVRAYNAKYPITSGIPPLTGQARTLSPLQPGDVALEVTFQYPKERSGSLSLFLKQELDCAATALRLSHPGAGFIRYHDYEYANFFPETGIFGFTAEFNPRRFSYVVNNEVAVYLTKRWPDSIAIAKRLVSETPDISTHLRIAIERFNSSFGNKIATDQLLDYMIALEALCSRERDAVSYRVELRVATLIGKDASDRQDVFDLVVGAYDERSHLSHGRMSKLTSGDSNTARAYLLKIEEAVLRTIHFFIQAEMKKKKKEEVLKIVDTAIATQDRTVLESSLISNY